MFRFSTGNIAPLSSMLSTWTGWWTSWPGRGYCQCLDIIHRMGQAPTLSQNILSHIKGQLYLGRATLLIMRAVKDQGACSSVWGVRKVIAWPMLQLLAGWWRQSVGGEDLTFQLPWAGAASIPHPHPVPCSDQHC